MLLSRSAAFAQHMTKVEIVAVHGNGMATEMHQSQV